MTSRENHALTCWIISFCLKTQSVLFSFVSHGCSFCLQTLILRPVDKKLVEVGCGAVQEWLQFLPLQGNVRNRLAIKGTREQLFIPSDVMDKIKVFCYYSHSKVYGWTIPYTLGFSRVLAVSSICVSPVNWDIDFLITTFIRRRLGPGRVLMIEKDSRSEYFWPLFSLCRSLFLSLLAQSALDHWAWRAVSSPTSR